MSRRVFHSRFQMSEIPMPSIGAQVGVTFKLENVNKVEPRRTVNGALVITKSPFPRKVRLTVSASGKAIQAEPAWRAIDLGGTVTISSPKTVTDYLLPGQVSTPVDHDIVVGSRIVAHDGLGNFVAATWIGRTISIAAAVATIVTLRWQPIYVCALISHSGDAVEVEGSQTWDGVFEEQ